MYRILASVSRSPTIVVVEMRGCPYCRMMLERLREPEVRSALSAAGVTTRVVQHTDAEGSEWSRVAAQQHGSVGFPLMGVEDPRGNKTTFVGLQDFAGIQRMISATQ